MVEEGENVKSKFAPSFLHGSIEFTSIHDGCGIVETRAADHGTIHVPVCVVSDERYVEKERAPLTREKIENVVRRMNGVLGQNQRVQIVALVNRILIVGFKFIEGDDVPNGEEDEKGRKDERYDIAKRGESERHLHGRLLLPTNKGDSHFR